MRTAVLFLALFAAALAAPLAEIQGNTISTGGNTVSGSRNGIYTGGNGINSYGGGGSNVVATGSNTVTGTGNTVASGGNNINAWGYGGGNNAVLTGGNTASGTGNHVLTGGNRINSGTSYYPYPYPYYAEVQGAVEVKYNVEYPNVNECPPKSNSKIPSVNVIIPSNGSALNVMEASVDISPAYRFTATYFGSTLGYFITTINGTPSSQTCYWFFYYKEPGSLHPIFSNVGVSNYHIPTNGYTIIMRYESLSHLVR